MYKFGLKNYLSITLIACLSLFATETYANINILGGGSAVAHSGNESIQSPSLLLGGELTLNVFDIVELGGFYDHNFIADGSAQFYGLTTRIGLGPIAGLFVDAQLGGATLNDGNGNSGTGVGGGLGIGWRLNRLSPRVGVRALGGLSGVQTFFDFGLMIRVF